MTEIPNSPDDWLELIHEQFARESDRAAAVLVGAMLDRALGDLLERCLLPPLKPERSLLYGNNAPLGTLSARIDAAHQLGLISRYMARDLHLVRKIRNEFAHHPLQATFGEERIRDWVRVLEEGSDYNRRQPALRASIGPPGTRGDFLGIAAWMLFSLRHSADEATNFKACAPEFGYIDWESLPPELKAMLEKAGAT